MATQVTIQFTTSVPARHAIAERAINSMASAINSRRFEELVLAQQFSDGTFYDVGGVITQVRDPAQVLRLIRDGVESGTSPDRLISLRVRDEQWAGEIGHTDEHGVIHTNGWFIDMNESECSGLAGHWTHEWMHNVGFYHDRRPTRRRPWSVPYLVGYIVEYIVSQSPKTFDEWWRS